MAGLVRERAENQPSIGLDSQLFESVPLLLEIRRETALAADPFLECNAREIAREVVCPIVIDAGEFAYIAAAFVADERALMGAAVHHGVDRPALRPHHHHGGITHIGRLVVAGMGDLAFQCKEAPRRPPEDALLLQRIKVRIGVDAVGRV